MGFMDSKNFMVVLERSEVYFKVSFFGKFSLRTF